MATIDIKIYFDTICAWCPIAHRTLFQSLGVWQKTYPSASTSKVHFHWLPFYRDRTLPLPGVPLEERLSTYLGSDKVPEVKARVQRIGRVHGFNFTFDNVIGNTKDSHCLVHYAGVIGGGELQKSVVEQLYYCWHERGGGDITSIDFLVECAVLAGMKKDDVIEVLESGKYREEIDRLDTEARDEGVSCVPTFLINGQKIEGAEDTATFYEAFVAAVGGGGDK